MQDGQGQSKISGTYWKAIGHSFAQKLQATAAFSGGSRKLDVAGATVQTNQCRTACHAYPVEGPWSAWLALLL